MQGGSQMIPGRKGERKQQRFKYSGNPTKKKS
uniref:Uncharacterized protein n=1 Tax=Anguilla anguilla TaxID=7936 RepID=A0A0E9UYX9_ANGAN